MIRQHDRIDSNSLFDHLTPCQMYRYIWRLCCQEKVSQAGTRNYTRSVLWNVITNPCRRYLLLAPKSSFNTVLQLYERNPLSCNTQILHSSISDTPYLRNLIIYEYLYAFTGSLPLTRRNYTISIQELAYSLTASSGFTTDWQYMSAVNRPLAEIHRYIKVSYLTAGAPFTNMV